jgi:hypothetical protein
VKTSAAGSARTTVVTRAALVTTRAPATRSKTDVGYKADSVC